MQRGIHGLASWLKGCYGNLRKNKKKKEKENTEPTETHKEQRKAMDNAENQLLPFAHPPSPSPPSHL